MPIKFAGRDSLDYTLMIAHVNYLSVCCEFMAPAAILKTPYAVCGRAESGIAVGLNRKRHSLDAAEIALDTAVVGTADPEPPVVVADLAAEIVPAPVETSRQRRLLAIQ